ncbi:MAG: UUP1 family membrane protein, partial [Pseudomonadota bacterium]|nr:UUP1 family membrane protein [Pseudomonadota bacterium]
MSRLPFYFIVGVLLLVGIVASVHRHLQFEIPWFPGEQRQVWEVEAVINFNAQNGPVQVDLALPSHQA